MSIEKVGVVGCGLMGAGIVQTAAQAGYTTIVRELNDELLEKGLGRISAFLDKGVEKKKLTQAQRDATWSSIHGTTDLNDLADCDLVIEVIYEDLQAKQELFKALDGICKESTILYPLIIVPHLVAIDICRVARTKDSIQGIGDCR